MQYIPHGHVRATGPEMPCDMTSYTGTTMSHRATQAHVYAPVGHQVPAVRTVHRPSYASTTVWIAYDTVHTAYWTTGSITRSAEVLPAHHRCPKYYW